MQLVIAPKGWYAAGPAAQLAALQSATRAAEKVEELVGAPPSQGA
jgi:hypothetical protein